MNIKKTIFKSFLILLMTPFIFACSDNFDGLSVRVKVKSEFGKDVDFKVFLENSSGQNVNGAQVYASSSSGIVEILEFENENQFYFGSINGCEDDFYTIKVKSNLLKSPYVLKVPHTRLTTKPVLTTFADSLGNNVLKGNSLKKENEIQLAWTDIGENITYQVLVKNTLITKWSASVKNCNVIIPSNTLEDGAYYLVINAQKSYGDIFYDTEDFYSVSNISSATVSFCLE